jgi:type VI protein secretion system component Hcp
MFKRAIRVLLLLFLNLAVSQEFALPVNVGDDFLFFRDKDSKVHILKNNIDYVFENKKWNKTILSYSSSIRDSSIIFYEKGFNNVNFKHINTENKSFLILNGGGPVLQIEKDKIVRIDNSVEQKNQYGAAIFEHNNQLHMNGGYGFWSFKDYTTFFDTSTGQWELCVFDPAPKVQPRWKSIFHKTKNDLYVLGGRSALDGNQRIDAAIKDVFKIDFQKKSIELFELGFNPQIPITSSSFQGFKINNQKGYLEHLNIAVFDFENNSVTEYDTAELFKNKVQGTPILSTKDSLLFINNKQGNKTIEFISIQRALQKPLKTVSILNVENTGFSYKKIFAFSSAVLIALFLYFLFGYKDYINKLVHHDNQWLYYANNKITISNDQSRVIELLEKNGQFSSTELNKIISKNKTYAKSHLTHLRQTFIENLNLAYYNLTSFTEPLISSTKNPADKRQLIYFAGNKIFKKKSFFGFVFKK